MQAKPDERVGMYRRDGKQIKDDYDNLKAETKVLNEIIERLQGVEGSNSKLLSDADQLRYPPCFRKFASALCCTMHIHLQSWHAASITLDSLSGSAAWQPERAKA